MHYPKELQFTESEEKFCLAQTDYETPAYEIKDIMEYLEMDYSISDFTDMKHLKTTILDHVQNRITVITDELTFEELVNLQNKLDKRAVYRNKPYSGIKYHNSGVGLVNLMVDGLYIEDVKLFTDSEMNERPYIAIDHTVIYLDTLDEI